MGLSPIWTMWCDDTDCLDWAGQEPVRGEAIRAASVAGWRPGHDTRGHLTGRWYCPEHYPVQSVPECPHGPR